MSRKVLVADDSATIQKVISIILAKESVELAECSSESKLLELIDKEDFGVILLDIDLSTDKSGYDLIREIKQRKPKAAILSMFGTYDKIDEAKLNEAGSSAYVVKPFNNSQFLATFRDLLSETTDFDSSFDELEDSSLFGDDDFGNDVLDSSKNDDFNPDNWVTRAPAIIENEKEEDGSEGMSRNVSEANELQNVVSDWGMEIPSSISALDDSEIEFPPQIDALDKNLSDQIEHEDLEPEEQASELPFPNKVDEPIVFESATDDKQLFPENEDLEYPKVQEDVHELKLDKNGIDFEDISEVDAKKRNKNKFVDLDELKLEDDDPSDHLTSLNASSNNDRIDLQKEIDDDIDPESLWDSDPTGEFHNPNAKLKDLGQYNQAPALSEEQMEKIVLEVKRSISEKLDDIVRDICAEKVESVAWEVIPEIAESLIKDEIQSITKNVIGDEASP